MNTYLFIAVCILAILTVLLYTFVSSAIHKRDLCRKSPYYFCDTDWLCCKPGSNNCDTSAQGPTVSGNDANAYYLTDQLYGANKGANPSGLALSVTPCANSSINKTYYEACIEPVKLITAYYNSQNQQVPSGVLDCLYTADSNVCDSVNFNKLPTDIPELKDLEVGQCCYKPFDPTPANTNNQLGSSTAYFPATGVNNPVWATLSSYPNQYSSNSGYNFAPKNQDTTNHSCFNTFYGGPTSVSASYRYYGCLGNQ